MFWQRVIRSIRQNQFLHREKHYPELVSKQLQNQLRTLATRATPAPLDINLEIHHRMLGEGLSPYAKSGFEFAETRLYQAGDNVRHINWRRYANTGELYINTFHEERRPQCWVIMDRRSNMRFGTRVRLKVEQAAIHALYYLFKAQQHQMDIGGVILDEDLRWFEAKSAAANLQPLIQKINAPAPPIADNANDRLNQTLRLLNVRLSPGCLIIFISDFSDLSPDDTSYLNALTNKHTLAAVHIIDPIEASVPTHGLYNILQPSDQSIIKLDCNNPAQKQQLNTQLHTRLYNIEQIFEQSHVHYKQAFSDEDFQEQKMSVSK